MGPWFSSKPRVGGSYSRRRAAAAFIGALSCATLGTVLFSAQGSAPLALGRCTDEGRAVLAEWDARLQGAMADPDGPLGARVLRIPTATLGVWVRVATQPPDALRLERISNRLHEAVVFDAGCRAEHSANDLAAPPAHAFTDARLAARLARGDAGVILLWSPHMPLSVDQFSVLAAATSELELALVAVLDPAADPGYAARTAAAQGIDAAALAPLASIELAFRGMTTHAPSLQVFRGGRLIGPVLFGFRDATAVRDILRRTLALP